MVEVLPHVMRACIGLADNGLKSTVNWEMGNVFRGQLKNENLLSADKLNLSLKIIQNSNLSYSPDITRYFVGPIDKSSSLHVSLVSQFESSYRNPFLSLSCDNLLKYYVFFCVCVKPSSKLSWNSCSKKPQSSKRLTSVYSTAACLLLYYYYYYYLLLLLFFFIIIIIIIIIYHYYSLLFIIIILIYYYLLLSLIV